MRVIRSRDVDAPGHEMAWIAIASGHSFRAQRLRWRRCSRPRLNIRVIACGATDTTASTAGSADSNVGCSAGGPATATPRITSPTNAASALAARRRPVVITRLRGDPTGAEACVPIAGRKKKVARRPARQGRTAGRRALPAAGLHHCVRRPRSPILDTPWRGGPGLIWRVRTARMRFG
jgi:hypothetical protein